MSAILKSFFSLILLATSLSAFNYNSQWVNKNLNTRSIKSISIRGGKIDVIGSCKLGSCSWGSVAYDSIPNGLVASWKYPRIGHKVLVVVATGANEVKVITKYLYNGRQNTTTVVDQLRIQTTQNSSSISATAQAPKTLSNVQAPVQRQIPQQQVAQQQVPQPQVKTPKAVVAPTPTVAVATQHPQNSIAGLSANANLFVGKWSNDDTYTRGVTRLQIVGAKDSLIIYIWGRGGCYPDECRWGKHRLAPSGDGYVTRWIQDGIDKSLKIEGIYRDQNGAYKMLRAKTTNIVKGYPEPKYRTFYLKKLQ